MTVQSQILAAIQGDTTAIRTLAAALARNDVAAIQDVLRAHGVAITDSEVASTIQGAADGSAFSYTWT